MKRSRFKRCNGNPPNKYWHSKVKFSIIEPARRIHMKIYRYSESQIINILKEAESGVPITELCRKYGMGDATFYNW